MNEKNAVKILVVSLALLGILHSALLAYLLLYPDLNLDYPFAGGDTFDWISQAMRYVGYDVRHPGRPVLFPLVMAGLESVSLLYILPVLIQLLIAATSFVLARTLWRLYSTKIALIVTVAFFLNASWRSFGLQIVADVPAACLLVLALAAFSKALDDSRWYLATGLLTCLSAMTQPLGVLLVLPIGVVVLVFRRAELGRRWVWLGLVALIGPWTVWLAVQRLLFGPPGEGPLHWPLLGFFPDNLLFYGWTFAAFVGLPGFALLPIGIAASLRRFRKMPFPLVLVISFALFFGFFALFYGFASKRFLLFAYSVVPFLWAEGLNKIQRPWLATGVGSLLIIWSWFPLPGPPTSPQRLPLWPVPPVVATSEVASRPLGDVRPTFNQIEIQRLDGLVKYDVLEQAWIAHENRHNAARNDVSLSPQDGSVVFLYHDENQESQRYVTVCRLGNALHRRVKFVSRRQLSPYIDMINLEPIGHVLNWGVFRAELNGLEKTCLFAVPQGDEDLGFPANSANQEQSRIPNVIQRARTLMSPVPENDNAVVVVTRPRTHDVLLTYLACLSPSSNFYVIESDSPDKDLQELGCENPALFGTQEEDVVAKCVVAGYQATIIRLAG